MNEFQLIQTYFNQADLSFSHPNICHSIGDDCAELSIPSGKNLVTSIDTLVDGVHFPQGASAYDIATRSLCVSLSDLAAMGAVPIGFTLAITLPSLNEQWVKEFSGGLIEIARMFNCPLFGGDTTKGPVLVITIQVHGFVARGASIKRSGAQVGDKVYVSGCLGDGAGALPIVLNDPLIRSGLAQHFYKPLPRIDFGQSILPYATSALDISDGLIQDLGHICAASEVGMEIDIDSIPMSELLLNTYDREQALQYALNGGDDYQLAYTSSHCENGICIGRVVEGNQVLVDGQLIGNTGYQHF